MTTTQLAMTIEPTAPLQSRPIVAVPLYICPVRDRCLAEILAKNDAYRCGFEQAGSVMACQKREQFRG